MTHDRYYARAAGDPRLIDDVAARLRAEWDPAGEFEAPDGSRRPEAHAATILAILSTGANTAGVKGYLRRAEEAALSAARSSSRERGDLAEKVWRMLVDAAVRCSGRALVHRQPNDRCSRRAIEGLAGASPANCYLTHSQLNSSVAWQHALVQNREPMFEHVLRVDDYYDGIREGVALFRGTPYHFRATGWLAGDPDEDLFELRPVDREGEPPILARGDFRRSASAPDPQCPPLVPHDGQWTVVK